MPSDTPIYKDGHRLVVSMPAYEGIYADRGWSLTPAQPAKSATKQEWVAYAVEHGGLPEHDANQLTRDQLVKRFTTEVSTDVDTETTSSPSGDDQQTNQEA